MKRQGVVRREACSTLQVIVAPIGSKYTAGNVVDLVPNPTNMAATDNIGLCYFTVVRLDIFPRQPAYTQGQAMQQASFTPTSSIILDVNGQK